MRTVRAERLTFGAGLLAIGFLWTLSNLGQLDLLETLHRWWPSLLVLWGALDVYNAYAVRRTREDASAVPAQPASTDEVEARP